MSLISTLTSSSSSLSSLSATTSSAITIDNVLIGTTIAIGVLVFVLFLHQLAVWERNSWDANTARTRRFQMIAALIPTWREYWNVNTAATLRAIYLPLFLTFCAFIVFKVAQAA